MSYKEELNTIKDILVSNSEHLTFLRQKVEAIEEMLGIMIPMNNDKIISEVTEDKELFEKKNMDLFAKALSMILKKVQPDGIKYICMKIYDAIKPIIRELHAEYDKNDKHEEAKDDNRFRNILYLRDPSFHAKLQNIIKRLN